MIFSPILERFTPPSVPAASRIYAVGDIHGRADLLERLLSMIEDDAASSAATRRVVVFLGDYVDRGPQSRRVVERLIGGPPPGFDWVCLRGNHEDSMLRFLDDPLIAQSWLRNGGLATIADYAGGRATGESLTELRETFADTVPRRHLEFMEALPLRHVEGRYVFVHAGLRPGRALEAQSGHDMMWIREEFLLSNASFGKIVVHGHTISDEPEIRHNRIGIDTGAYASGRLTALVLEGRRRGFLMTDGAQQTERSD